MLRRFLPSLPALLSGLAVVLVFAGVSLVLSGALSSEAAPARVPASAARLPGTAATSPVDFSLGKARARVRPGESVIVRARRPRLDVYARRGARRPVRTLRPLVVEGKRVPLVLSQVSRRRGWLHVRLPIRPNGSTGWVRARDVRTAVTPLRVVVRLSRHRLELWDRSRLVLRRPIAVGRALSPTPTGSYFLVDVLRPPDPDGFYGPYALGLSAYSPVYTSFAGGNGQVGIHGTNRPSVLGQNVSHGCIRVDNATITRLARRLPLGTPVEIRRS